MMGYRPHLSKTTSLCCSDNPKQAKNVRKKKNLVKTSHLGKIIFLLLALMENKRHPAEIVLAAIISQSESRKLKWPNMTGNTDS